LIYASNNGHLDIVQYLISKGANIEAKSNGIFRYLLFFNGRTAINWAKNNKIKEILKKAKKKEKCQ
jgi:ankyrin repeat protein